jgi:hypothetical protein
MRENGVLVLRNDQGMLECFLHAPRGPFYSPKAARSRWRHSWKAKVAFCLVAHRTVRCTTGQPLFMSGARFPSIPGAADHCNFGLVGAPDTDRCTPDSPVPPADRWLGPRVARGLRGRPLRWWSLAHRTVRWIIVVRHWSFPESGQFAGAGLAHRTLSGVPDWAESWLLQPSLFLFLFSLILALRQTSLVPKTNELSLETYLLVDLHFIHHMTYNHPLNMCWTLNHQNILEMVQGHIFLSTGKHVSCVFENLRKRKAPNNTINIDVETCNLGANNNGSMAPR